jgi:hypothetical protein
MTTTPATPGPLPYADPATNAARPRAWSRLALVALLWSLLTSPPLTVLPLMGADRYDLLPDHFLCCGFPQVSFLVFVGLPVVGCALGMAAMLTIHRTLPRRRGTAAAVVAIVVATISCALGFGLISALKA